jgi:hypothetical protein
VEAEVEPGEGAGGWLCKCGEGGVGLLGCAAALYKAGRVYFEMMEHV